MPPATGGSRLAAPSAERGEMQIIDPHHHFWDIARNRHPWLADEPVAFRYGDYTALKRNYGPDDYRVDAAGFDVIASVHIEAEWDRADPLGETAWIGAVHAQSGLPSAMVAQAWLDRDDVETVLRAHAQAPLVRGVRHKPRAAPRPEMVTPGAPGSMGDPAWRRGAALLAPAGLSLDLQTPWWHLREALDLAEALPELSIILNHAGLPSDRSRDGLHAWRDAMRRLAQAPNVSVKISGLGAPGVPWTVAANAPVVRDVIDIFGPARCMFASNYPVDSLVASFATIFRGFDEITQDLDPSARAGLFRENAARLYRLSGADRAEHEP